MAAVALLHDNAALVLGARPNIVVIMTDDATNEGFGFNSALYGHPTPYETPNIDALAQRSVVARQGYAAAPLCSPSRAGLLTGQYQQRHGYWYNLDYMATALPQGQGLRVEQLTIAQHLKGLGYSTGMIGKWHLGFEDGLNLPPDKGFDEFYGFWGGSRHYFFEWEPENLIRRGDTLYENEHRAGGTNDPNDPNANDPIKGRYVTDAFGDEAVDFINRHAPEADPFFLFLAPNAPHSPVEAKQSDLSRFAHITDPSVRVLAAATYAIDRAVGRVVEAAEASGEETIIVFMNDNGGPYAPWNTPLRGNKGLMWEGGIRVPFLIHAPGIEPGLYDAPISAYDVLPTLYAAAGGDVAELNSDGVDLMPYLSGSNTEDPHDVLVWQTHNLWAIRKGDWKIGSPSGGPVVLYNLANDPAETTDVSNQNPTVVEDLLREMTYWESEMDKSRWGAGAGNPFDHFVFKGNSNWFTTPNVWAHPDTGATVQLRRSDAYPNLILEFQTKDTGSYGGFNSMSRETGQPMMINDLRFTGNFQGQSSFLGGFGGNPLLFVNNLNDAGPVIRLDATSTGTNATFRFDVNSELQLFNDLEITGNGTQNFFINGNIRDYYEPRSVTKTGTSVLNLTGNNTFRGHFSILGGEVKLSGPGAAINGANSILLGPAATLAIDGGLVATPRIDNSAGGNFMFTGGELRTENFFGNLKNQGGNFSPGSSTAVTNVSGYFTQTSGNLTIELGGTQPGSGFDQLLVSGTASLGGQLQVNLVDGFFPADGNSFEFLVAGGGITGTFANTIFPSLGNGWSWDLIYGPTTARLVVDFTPNPLLGDYNYNGIVDAADYAVWRKAFGSTTLLAADGDGDGTVDQDDYVLWRTNFGKTAPPPPASGSFAGVPEPSTMALALLTLFSFVVARRRSAA